MRTVDPNDDLGVAVGEVGATTELLHELLGGIRKPVVVVVHRFQPAAFELRLGEVHEPQQVIAERVRRRRRGDSACRKRH